MTLHLIEQGKLANPLAHSFSSCINDIKNSEFDMKFVKHSDIDYSLELF